MKFNNHRYTLRRSWLGSGGVVNFVMLNPSKADDVFNDATVRRIISYAQIWGFSGLVVSNLFAYRSTSPLELCKIDPALAIGGAVADAAIRTAAMESSLIVCAWGEWGHLYERDRDVFDILQRTGIEIKVFGLTRAGRPLHPVRLPYSKMLQHWDGPEKVAA